MPLAHSSTLKPGGTLILLTGISAAGLGAGGCACGESGELIIDSGRPCCQGGGACARTSGGTTRPSAMTAAATPVRRMMLLLREGSDVQTWPRTTWTRTLGLPSAAVKAVRGR